MAEQSDKPLTYEQKEERLDAILRRLDKSETPMDDLAAEVREASGLIMEMQATLNRTRAEVTKVFADMEKQRPSPE